MVKKQEVVQICLQPVNMKKMKLNIKGKTPLLMDRFSDEVMAQILAKQTGVAKGNKKKVRDTEKETQDSVHVTSEGFVGFPVYGFKKGMMECTSFVGDKMFSKKLVSGAVKIVNGVDGLIPIEYEKQDVLKHSIKGQTKFTPQFHKWSCELELLYDANNISSADIATLVNYAGFYCGIGAWRPKGRDGGSGEFGMYEVMTDE